MIKGEFIKVGAKRKSRIGIRQLSKNIPLSSRAEVIE
jgi:hypothetical protein